MIDLQPTIVPGQSERRREPRVPFGDPVGLRGSQERTCTAVDLSRHGVALRSREPLQPSAAVEVVFLDNSVMTKGIVRNCTRLPSQEFRIGVEFENEERDLVEVLLMLRGIQAH